MGDTRSLDYGSHYVRKFLENRDYTFWGHVGDQASFLGRLYCVDHIFVGVCKGDTGFWHLALNPKTQTLNPKPYVTCQEEQLGEGEEEEGEEKAGLRGFRDLGIRVQGLRIRV